MAPPNLEDFLGEETERIPGQPQALCSLAVEPELELRSPSAMCPLCVPPFC